MVNYLLGERGRGRGSIGSTVQSHGKLLAGERGRGRGYIGSMVQSHGKLLGREEKGEGLHWITWDY